MRVTQCVHSYDACDLYTIISRSCTRKDSWAEDICNYICCHLVGPRSLIKLRLFSNAPVLKREINNKVPQIICQTDKHFILQHTCYCLCLFKTLKTFKF